ncbi:hypothetical protein OG204_13410 [Streptomyces sp. NBC_01387]|uniref:hypothetical protein n=1 Tax=unclassified Streptomyces TaxID=2593676 RepID=UPI002251C0AC|nr:hypothetical protein [Streptomyces sp. NBC_01500]MCX4550764.1 hypothetical protein [Streptomyces sp. NBC_01500]
MNRSTWLVTAAITASTAVLLTACGSSGGGDSSASDKIKGADGSSGKASASASASAAPGGVKRPQVAFPKDFQANFEGWTNSDPKLQAIMNDGAEQLKSEYAAIIDAQPDSGGVAFYNSGGSLASAKKWIKSYVATDDSLVGKVRVYAPQVHINSTGSGVLFYCVDEGKAYTKNRKTNKVTGTPDGVSPTLQYRTLLDRTAQGVWKTISLETVRGACG